MRGENMEQLWYGFCFIKAVVILFVLSAFVLLCKRLLRCIPWNQVKLHSGKDSMVHPLNTRQLTRMLDASESEPPISTLATQRALDEIASGSYVCTALANRLEGKPQGKSIT